MSLPDLRALLAAFSEGGVDFVVIGGIALALHGSIRTTEDLDIVPDPDPANLDRLCRLLEAEQGASDPERLGCCSVDET
jgi:c-di-GMP-binding flagellar brake protein YcgR